MILIIVAIVLWIVYISIFYVLWMVCKLICFSLLLDHYLISLVHPKLISLDQQPSPIWWAYSFTRDKNCQITGCYFIWPTNTSKCQCNSILQLRAAEDGWVTGIFWLNGYYYYWSLINPKNIHTSNRLSPALDCTSFLDIFIKDCATELDSCFVPLSFQHIQCAKI